MQPPTPTDKRCAVQLGNTVQLGVEVVNQSPIGTAKVAVSDVGGFSDLGEVHYTGCSASPG